MVILPTFRSTRRTHAKKRRGSRVFRQFETLESRVLLAVAADDKAAAGASLVGKVKVPASTSAAYTSVIQTPLAVKGVAFASAVPRTSNVADDFAGNTGTTGTVTVGGTRTGVVGTANDRDWFRVSLDAGTTYRFNLNRNTLSDPSLYLRNSSGSQLAFNDDFGGSLNSQITFTPTSSGNYFLDAGAFGAGTGSYTLAVSVVDDFDASTNTTGTVTVGGTRTGLVGTANDRDWFRVSLDAGTTYRFNLNRNTLSDPSLSLRNSAGSQVAFNDDFGGSLNSQITFTPTSSGNYFLDAGDFGTGTGSYTLAVSVVDDFDANTNTTGTVTVGGTRTGLVGAVNDRDWFRVSLTAGRSYRFNLDGGTLSDPSLYLRNSSGSQLAFNDDFGGGLNSQITFVPTSSATYFLDAGAFGTGTGSYTLRAVDTSPTDDFSADTNTAGTVAIGGSRTGTVERESDRDWFQISLTAGRSYRFNLDGNTLSDPALSLRNSAGSQLAFSDDFNGSLNSQITFTPTSSGNYFLDAGAFGTGTGSYTLRAVDTSPTDDFSADINTTGTVTIGGSRTGVVERAGDRDWFRISLSAGGTYRFNLNGTTLRDPTLSLRNASGSQVVSNDDFTGLNSQITFTPTTSGVFYLDAGEYSSGTGSYTLLATQVSAPPPSNDDFAANTGTTGLVTVGGSQTGVVNSSGDRDWFRVALAAGQRYRFSLNGTSLSDTTLYLRDGSGQQLEFNDDFNGFNSQISYTTTAAGTYYLDAGGFGGAVGSYTLLASLVTPPTPPTDDYAGSSATTGVVSVGGSQAGVVNSNGDRDWFRVMLQAGRTYTIAVQPGALTTPDLFLRRADGTQISFANGSAGSNTPIIIFSCTASGTYFLDVGADRNVGVGNYTVRVLDSLLNDDFAASTLTTGAVTVGGNRTGVVNFNGDRDWFRISLTAGQTYRFNCNGSSLGDPTLVLRDASGNALASNDDFGGTTNSQITFAITTTGTYYLDAGAFGSGLGSYTVTAVSTTPVSDDFSGDTSTNGSLNVGSQIAGAINFVGDIDWFRVSLQGGRTYRFNLNGNTLSNPTMSLWDGSGGQRLTTNDDFGGTFQSQITYTPSATGTFFLEAAAVGSLMGTYALTATDVTPNSPDRIPGLGDAAIRNAVNTALSDNVFSHQELASLIRGTGANGVSAAEFADLGRIATNMGSYLNAATRSYTQYIFGAVVNGNAANQWWTGGGGSRVSLGNLAVGSVQLVVDRLVDKWFAGRDLPANFVGGDAAAGASSFTFTYGDMTGPLFENGVAYSDVDQGQAGTCYFLAAAATLANNQGQFIRNNFVDNADGTYGVRFYGDSGNEIWVTVNRSVPVVSGRLALAGNSGRSLSGEMWVALAEKAYAQANEIGQFGRSVAANSYFRIEGGWEEALRHISNRPTTAYSSYWTNSGWISANNSAATWNGFLNTAISAVNSGRSLLLLCYRDTYDSSGKLNFVGSHAFAITGYNATTQRFTIANPWGAGSSTYAGVFEATWSEIGSVRGVVAWA